MIRKGIDVSIVKMIRADKSITDDAIATRLGINRQVIREERRRLKIASAITRRRNTAFLYLDDNPNATSKELADYLFSKGYHVSANNAWDYRRKYKTVQAERLKEKALWNQYTSTKQAA